MEQLFDICVNINWSLMEQMFDICVNINWSLMEQLFDICVKSIEISIVCYVLNQLKSNGTIVCYVLTSIEI